jgi:hypothetical protein
MINNFSGKVSLTWSMADLLRDSYRTNRFKKVMLPIDVREEIT